MSISQRRGVITLIPREDSDLELLNNFTLLFAKYYLCNTKLTHGEISMPDFIAKVNHKYLLEGLNA